MSIRLSLVLAGAGCVAAPRSPAPNVLLIVLDDVGPDGVGVYGEIATPPLTPHLDALATTGMRFTRAHASPVCAPSRAAVLTGRHARRTGHGENGAFGGDVALPRSEITIAELLRAHPTAGYRTAAVGKWHLANRRAADARIHAMDQGFERTAVTLGNIYDTVEPDGERHDYFHWEELVDGEPIHVDGYNTTAIVDHTIEAVRDLGEPWFAYVAFNSAHDPWHVPPAELQSVASADESDRHVLWRAMVEAADTEIGRLIDTLPRRVRARTHVVVLGDNGTRAQSAAPDWDVRGHKATMSDGGIRVPLIVSGPAVAEPGAVNDGLVHVVDVFATIAEWAGVTPTAVIDGRSLGPMLEDPSHPGLRDAVFAEWFSPTGVDEPRRTDRRVLVDHTHKLFVRAHLDETQLRAVGPSPRDETSDLLPDGLDAGDEAALTRLQQQLDALMASFSSDPP